MHTGHSPLYAGTHLSMQAFSLCREYVLVAKGVHQRLELAAGNSMAAGYTLVGFPHNQ